MRFKMMAVVMATTLSVPAVAQTDAAAPAPTPKPQKERKVCREKPMRTGSNFVASICKTKAEWAAIDGTDAPVSSDGARSSTDTGSLGTGVR